MLSGLPPFYHEDFQQIGQKILQEPLKFCTGLTDPDARDLLNALLQKDPQQRLSDVKLIKAHPFFVSIDWEAMENLRVAPPYIPRPIIEDYSDFFIIEEEESTGTKRAQEASAFAGFTFVAPNT